MTLRKLLSALTVVAVCLAWSAGDASAQARGHASGGGAHSGGAHVGAAAPRGGPGPAPSAGHAVARPPYGGHYPVYGRPGYPYRPYYGYPYYRPYYPYYGYGYPYYGYPGFSIGFGIGFGYGYGYYGYGYPYYGYAYPGYTYAAPAYVTTGNPTSGQQGQGYPSPGYPQSQGYGNSGPAYGGVRITGAPPDAQVFSDGYFVGAMSDLNGGPVSLTAGVHKIEVRVPGQQSIEFDVNVQPGQTITYRAR
jgi:hypothetical protein